MKRTLAALVAAVLLSAIAGPAVAQAERMPEKDIYPYQQFEEVCTQDEDGVAVTIIAADNEHTLGRRDVPTGGWFYFKIDGPQQAQAFLVRIFSDDDVTQSTLYLDLDRDEYADEVLPVSQWREKYPDLNVCDLAERVK